jgi:uncharacterized alkaline shock family protein YloU
MSAVQGGRIDLLTVRRRVIAVIAASAARSAPGVERVGRGGPRLLAWLAGGPVEARLVDERVQVRLWLIVTTGRSFAEVVARVRASVGMAIEQQLGLALGEVTVLVDGVGG